MRFSESFFFAGSREPRDIYINVHSTGGQGDPGQGGDVPSAKCKWFLLSWCTERERERERECECECGMRMRMLERCACVRGGGERRLIGGGIFGCAGTFGQATVVSLKYGNLMRRKRPS